MTTKTEPTYNGKTAAQWREGIARENRLRKESQDRSDTDGFMSQWAHQLGAREFELCAKLAEANGLTITTAVFDLEGNLLDTVATEGQYGRGWMILDADGKRDVTKGRNGYFNPSRAATEERRRRANARHGFYEGFVRVPGTVEYVGGNLASVTVATLPVSKRIIAAEAEVVDNGFTITEVAPGHCCMDCGKYGRHDNLAVCHNMQTGRDEVICESCFMGESE